MIDCYKCVAVLDNGATFKNITCIVFTDDEKNISKIMNKKFEKSSYDSIEYIFISKINPKEGLVISCEC